MTVDSIRNGIVIDHITAGRGMELYRLLGLGELDCPVALLKNVTSTKMGRKDLIKIDGVEGQEYADLNLECEKWIENIDQDDQCYW